MRESSYLKNPGDVVVGDQEKEHMWVNSYKNSLWKCDFACNATGTFLGNLPTWHYKIIDL